MDYNLVFKEKIKFAEECLAEYMPSETLYPQEIFKAMRYSIFAGGKRLRPVMLFGAAEAVGGDVNKAKAFAAAIEMIHTYSLIHDDLPAMDNDDFRRGVPTNHKVFGENMAILAGDALLNHAFETMLNECCKTKDFAMVEAAAVIGEASGTKGMVSGQVVDVTNDGKEIDEETLKYIHENKTGAMIAGALKAGVILGGGTKEQIKKIGEAGIKIGVAFQIQDDILDVESTAEVLGKPINSDEKNKKTTYVKIHGMEKSKKDVERFSKEAIDILKGFGEKGEFLVFLTNHLIKRSF